MHYESTTAVRALLDSTRCLHASWELAHSQSNHSDTSERRKRRHPGEQNKIESMLIFGEGKKSRFAPDSALVQSVPRRLLVNCKISNPPRFPGSRPLGLTVPRG